MEISDLAQAFHAVGRSSAAADATFEQARKRFDAAWNHQNGDHPINDSAEVQRVIKSLGAQSEQLPKIGADRETIADLADAQKSGAAEIATLEGQLEKLDHMIDLAERDLRDHPTRRASKNCTIEKIDEHLQADQHRVAWFVTCGFLLGS